MLLAMGFTPYSLHGKCPPSEGSWGVDDRLLDSEMDKREGCFAIIK